MSLQKQGQIARDKTDQATAAEVLKLVNIMVRLRSPQGCPWDQKQTAASLKPCLLEETYELLEAIDGNDADEIRDELGDLLLQVVFIARIHEEKRLFNLADVAQAISDKLIRRHPHVFATEDAADHARRWEEIKQAERRAKGKNNRLADRIPKTLPALKTATKLARQRDEQQPEKIVSTLIENLIRLQNQLCTNPDKTAEDIIADQLFLTTQLATLLQLDAEDLLRKRNLKMITAMDIKS